jgi:hypothetical protein
MREDICGPGLADRGRGTVLPADVPTLITHQNAHVISSLPIYSLKT